MNQYIIALGMFDGVHLGHQELLKKTSMTALENGDTSVVFTYTNHPRELFCGSFEYLTPLDQRSSLYKSFGIEKVDAVEFTAEFAARTPEAFIEWLMNRYERRIGCIVCGYDYRFGKNATGDSHVLEEIGKKMGFIAEVLPAVIYAGQPCSSTRIREALKTGDLDSANGMLGRPYAINGLVVHNKAIGRKIGFPTANIDPIHQLLPKDGVYATALKAGDRIYASVTNIGSNPTVGGEKRTIETHIPNFDSNLYGRNVTVFFMERLRNEICFPDVESLKKQIAEDTATAKKVYKENEKSVYKFSNL